MGDPHVAEAADLAAPAAISASGRVACAWLEEPAPRETSPFDLHFIFFLSCAGTSALLFAYKRMDSPRRIGRSASVSLLCFTGGLKTWRQHVAKFLSFVK